MKYLSFKENLIIINQLNKTENTQIIHFIINVTKMYFNKHKQTKIIEKKS